MRLRSWTPRQSKSFIELRRGVEFFGAPLRLADLQKVLGLFDQKLLPEDIALST
jgi:hypothetical protein